MSILRRLLVVLMLVFASAPAFAVNPDEMLSDPALEARARAISANLRCLVCQNETIDDSDADLAHDLRVLVRDRLKAGDTNEQVIQYIVDRYGEYVLLKPVIAPHTIILWVATPTILVIGIVAMIVATRRRRGNAMAGPSELSSEERQALEDLEDETQGTRA